MTVSDIYGGTTDGFVGSTSTTYSTARSGAGQWVNSSYSYLTVGQQKDGSDYYCILGYLDFDTSVVGTDTVSDVSLSLAKYDDYTPTNFVVEARLCDWGTSLATGDWVAGDDLASYTLLASWDTANWTNQGAGTRFYFTSESAFAANINGAGHTRILLCSSRHRNNNTPTGDEYFQFYSANQSGTTDDPLLSVTHAPAPVGVAQEWDSSWLVHGLIAQEWDASWKCGMTNTRTLAQYSSWRVLSVPAACPREWDSSWRVTTATTQTWDGSWLVKATDPVAQTWDSEWLTHGYVSASFDSSWDVNRAYSGGRYAVATTCLLNGINLNNLTTTFLRPGVQLGDDGQEYDVVRHYDGSILVHDVRKTLVDMLLPLKLRCSDAATLKALVDSIRDAAVIGGTLTWQDGDYAGGSPGGLETFTIAPTSSTDATRDVLYYHQNMALWDLKLTRFPRS